VVDDQALKDQGETEGQDHPAEKGRPFALKHLDALCALTLLKHMGVAREVNEVIALFL
jgi:hypothetical protein